MPTTRMTLLLLIAAILLAPAPSGAQAMYLPPAYQATLPAGTPVLTIERKGARLSADTKVVISESQLVLIVPGRGRDVVLLSDRTIGEVADALQSKYPNDLVVTAFYPMHSARHIRAEGVPRALPFTGTAAAGEPSVAIGFGVVFAMADDDEAERDGLLAQTGFQLDLTGVHQLRGQQSSSLRVPGLGLRVPVNQVYVQARLGLNSDQSLNVVSTDTATEETGQGEEDPTGPQVEDALEQADQIALSLQAELVYSLGRGAEMALVPEYGQTWARLEPYVFPILTIEGEPQNSEAFFDDDLRRAALRQLNQTFPLRNYGASVVFRFIDDDRPLFHIGAGYVRKQVVFRGIRFRRDSAGSEPLPDFLEAQISTPDRGFWRGVFGARIPGVIDVRMDAVTPIDRKVGPPILRLVLAKNFPIGN